MKRVIEHIRMEKPDIAVASLNSKPKKTDSSGTVIPPPPIPARVQSIISIDKTTIPIISMGYIAGLKRSLCLHSFVMQFE